MRNGIFACAALTLAGFLVAPAPAQEPIQVPATVITSTESTTPSPRTGLFGRVRERRQMTTVVQPVPSGVITQTPPPVIIAPVQATETPAVTQTQVVESRPGLFARLRARR